MPLERKKLKGVNLKDMEASRCGTDWSKLEGQKHLERKEAKRGRKWLKKLFRPQIFAIFRNFSRILLNILEFYKNMFLFFSQPMHLHM